MHEFARAENEIAYGQLKGLTVAVGVISAVLFAIFRWPRLALVALAPNALPVVLVFGLLGCLGVPLDAGTVLIGGLAIGIAVDDTIHVASRFYDHLASGYTNHQALEKTFDEVLPAILSTTAVISVAFLVLGFSQFTITRNLGLLTSGIMMICLLADITLLPALLLRLPKQARPSAPSASR
jgi:predicted RND superfamily exporter protein